MPGETAYISGSFPLDFDLADGNPAILGRVESVEAEESNVANNAVTVVPQLTDKEAPLVQYFALPVGDAQVYGHGVFYTFEFQINDDLTSRPEFRIDYSHRQRQFMEFHRIRPDTEGRIRRFRGVGNPRDGSPGAVKSPSG